MFCSFVFNVLGLSRIHFEGKPYNYPVYFRGGCSGHNAAAQTISVTKEGFDVEDPENRMLFVQCVITVLPGNPTKISIDMDDWDTVRGQGRGGRWGEMS